MTADHAQQMTEKLLRFFGIIGWRVKVISVFPEHPKRLGLTSYRERTVYLAEHGLKDEREAYHTIYEEVAHAMTPGDAHGPRFKETFERIAYWTVYGKYFM
jgi:hypothetical protein